MMQKIIGPSKQNNTSDSIEEEEEEGTDEEPLTKKGTPEKRHTKTTPENQRTMKNSEKFLKKENSSDKLNEFTTQNKNLSNEIAPMWTIDFGNDKTYLIIKKCIGSKYSFLIENSDMEIHIIATYSINNDELKFIAHSLKLPIEFVEPHLPTVTMKTIINVNKPIHNDPTLYSKLNDDYIIVSFPHKKTCQLIIE